jgi:hypothetical protein
MSSTFSGSIGMYRPDKDALRNCMRYIAKDTENIHGHHPGGIWQNTLNALLLSFQTHIVPLAGSQTLRVRKLMAVRP